MTTFRIVPVAVSSTRLGYDVLQEGRRTEQLWFECEGHAFARAEDDCSIAFLALQHRLMTHAGSRVTVDGYVDRELARNLAEFRRIWQCWSPQTHGPVACDFEVREANAGRSDRTVSAFSGGVDAFFNIVQNRVAPPAERYAVDALALVHGLDIPVDQKDAFARAEDAARVVADHYGLSLISLRSNVRAFVDGSWFLRYDTALASCLMTLAPAFGRALLGSGSTYDELPQPYGAHPMSTARLSSGDLEQTLFGTGFSRMDKVRVISAEPCAREHLRVCWQTTSGGGNCGVCEKCTRTRLNFLVAGYAAVPALGEDPLRLSQRVRRLRIANDQTEDEFLALARLGQRSADASWVRPLRRRLRRERARRRLITGGPAAWAARKARARLAENPELYRRVERLAQKLGLV